MKWATFVNPGGCAIQLFEPASEGFLKKILDRRGEHVHHVAFLSSDVEATVDRAARGRHPARAGGEHGTGHAAVAEVELRPAGLRGRRPDRGRTALQRRGQRVGAGAGGSRASPCLGFATSWPRPFRPARSSPAAAVSCSASRWRRCARSSSSASRSPRRDDARQRRRRGVARRRRGGRGALGGRRARGARAALAGGTPDRCADASSSGRRERSRPRSRPRPSASTRSRGRPGSEPTCPRSTRGSRRRPIHTRAAPCSPCARSSPMSPSST